MTLGADLLQRLVAEAKAAEGMLVRWIADRPSGGRVFGMSPADDPRTALRVLFLAAAKRGRVQLVASDAPPTRKSDPSAFTRVLHGRLGDARLESVAVATGDRIVRATFKRDERTYTLVAELFGATPNLVLLDAERRIIAAEHTRRGARTIAAGQPYVDPPALGTSRAVVVAEDPPPAPSSAFADRFPLSAAVAAWLEPEDAEAAFLARKQLVLATIRDRHAREAKGLAHARSDLAEGQEAARTRQLADCLAAQFHALKRGQTSIDVDDLFGGGRATLALDPKLEPRDNLEAWYARARKLERKAESAAARIVQLEPVVATLARTIAAVDAIDLAHAAELDAFAVGPERAPAPANQTPRAKREAAKDPYAGLRRFKARSGAEILVGRTDRDNDRLTMRIARGNDVWLHLAHEPGSHVVLRVDKGKSASPEDLIDAALLAAHYSKRRGVARCEVLWTPRKYVRKPKGARPGAVTVERSKSLRLDVDAARLKAVLATSAQSLDDGN
jgi:predicted ribosome quality control (RQC) complex YloA/Tae2 family protein